MPKWIVAAVAAGAALVAFGAAGLLGRAPRTSSEIPTPYSVVRTAENPRTIGVSGCASTGCHGGSAMNSLTGKLDDRTWSGSASHWLAVDPHGQAYAALESPLAKFIMDRFAPGIAATDAARCLACHTNPSLARVNVEPRERQMRSEGANCEACHGDAGKWLPEHTSWTKSSRDAGYEATGMVKLFDVGERALSCVGCHVGAPADEKRGYPVRDMNHDMIAAGHPRLNFDFAEYQRRLPPHWKEEDASPEFELKAWLVGRAAQDEAGVKLAADRASRGRAGAAPWPEYADFRCVSCHHTLEDGFKSGSGKPTLTEIWPKGLDRVKLAAAPSAECAAQAEAAFQAATPTDADSASQMYHGLVARERMRMKHDGRTKYDPAFDRLRESLTQPRGNLDFRLKPEVAGQLTALMKR